jgi:hypothetical protein
LTYSLTYLMTTLARNSRNGIGLSVAAITGYTFLQMWLILWHGIAVPIVWELPEHPDRLDAGVWFGSLLGYLAVCLTLMVVTQFRFERAEV